MKQIRNGPPGSSAGGGHRRRTYVPAPLKRREYSYGQMLQTITLQQGNQSGLSTAACTWETATRSMLNVRFDWPAADDVAEAGVAPNRTAVVASVAAPVARMALRFMPYSPLRFFVDLIQGGTVHCETAAKPLRW